MISGNCNSLYVNEASLDDRSLYMNPALYPTIDRPKPLYRPSTVLVEDGGCDPQTAQWECIPYALDACEKFYSPTGFAEDYLQCLDDRFTACTSACGCNYQFNSFTQDFNPRVQQSLSSMIRNACQGPDMEFPSWKAYQNCVDRVTRMVEDGATNLAADRFGPVSNFGPQPPSLNGRYSGRLLDF